MNFKMKQTISVNIFLGFFSLMALVKCDSVQPLNYSLSGNIWDADFPKPLEGVEVHFDKNVYVTNRDGYFEFYPIPEGIHYLSISIPSFNNYSEVITLSKDVNVKIDLKGKEFSNYFPVETEHFVYNYYELRGAPRQWIYSQGKSYWDLQETTSKQDTIEYKFLETKILSSSFNPERIDTTKRIIRILQDSKDWITIVYLTSFETITFKKNINVFHPEEIEFNLSSGSYKIKRNKGISFFFAREGINYTKYELVE